MLNGAEASELAGDHNGKIGAECLALVHWVRSEHDGATGLAHLLIHIFKLSEDIS